MENLVELNRQKVFSYEEASVLLPIIQRITKQSSERVELLIQRIEAVQSTNNDLVEELEDQVNQEVQAWQTKMEKLGVRPKGLWVADFDSGDGYFCWKHPEEKLLFWHRYSDGFSGRIPIEKYLNNQIIPSTHSPEITV